MSDDALFSQNWYRVKDLKPRLAGDVTVTRHVYRGVPWYVLYRDSTNGHHRVPSREFELINSFDGTETIDALWHRAIESRDAEAPTQPELMDLLAQLHEADLLTVDRRLNAEMLFSRGKEAASRDTRQRFLNPLYLRFRLLDPDRMLDRVAWLGRALFGRAGAYGWACLMALTLIQLAPLWPQLRYEFAAFDFFSPANGIAFFLVFPVIKLLHEISHGLAVKRYGGEVHEMGVALLVLLPIPYVDASAATAFPDKHQRMLVGAAGILMELGIAAVAALIWAASEPGRVHDLAFMAMLVGGLSTVVFNGNPLLKFDGYYVLADALEMPNLADHSKRYLLGRLKQRLFGIPDAAAVVHDDWEPVWLTGYAIASTAYRLMLMISIAYMLSGRFFFFGVALAAWIVFMQLAVPAWKLLSFLAAQHGARRARALAVSGVLACLAVGLLGWLPVPLNTVTKGIVWLPENAIVRTSSRCEVIEVLASPGEAVQPGNALFRCDDAELNSEVAVLQGQLDELTAERAGLDTVDRAKQQMLDNEIATLTSRHARALQRQQALTVVARTAGNFTVAGERALAGQHLDQGAVAAYIVPDRERTVRVALEQSDVGYLADGIERIEVFFPAFFPARADNPAPLTTRIVRQTPQAGVKVPSPALTTLGGGNLVADTGDATGHTAVEPVFDLQLAWPAGAPDVQVGGHIDVKFTHPPAPLARRLVAGIRRAFLQRMDA